MNGFWRIIDANFNRSREGLRVCEDVTRFILDDRSLSSALKSLRHELNQVFLRLGKERKLLLKTREISSDVGKRNWILDQKQGTPETLLESNFKRAEEGLRVLEECTKIVARKLTPRIQALRFQVYELEKKTLTKF
ncbi:MAG: thiamine-phosphate pyrophosphorylase [Candidatus Omnitrophica bacterium]|nr:thiamine-phosphate pyrophosphorylase [Candidatus Omnitrophota bacterium]